MPVHFSPGYTNNNPLHNFCATASEHQNALEVLKRIQTFEVGGH